MEELQFDSLYKVTIPVKFTGIVTYPYDYQSAQGIIKIIIKAYYENGILHRKDGPAAIHICDGKPIRKFFIINGVTCTEQEWFESLPPEEQRDILYKLNEI